MMSNINIFANQIRPDLVVVTGDLTHGWCCHKKSPGQYHGDESACFGETESDFDWAGAFAQAVLWCPL